MKCFYSIHTMYFVYVHISASFFSHTFAVVLNAEHGNFQIHKLIIFNG